MGVFSYKTPPLAAISHQYHPLSRIHFVQIRTNILSTEYQLLTLTNIFISSTF